MSLICRFILEFNKMLNIENHWTTLKEGHEIENKIFSNSVRALKPNFLIKPECTSSDFC